MTTLTGTIKDGTIILDTAPSLPNGTKVEVTLSAVASATPNGEAHDELKQPGPHAWMLEFAGVLDDMPADFAQQHDHYIHGTPKR